MGNIYKVIKYDIFGLWVNLIMVLSRYLIFNLYVYI